jgi:hypothetical protein
MIVEKIKYSRYFPTPGEWIGLEGSLQEGEDVLAAYAEAHKLTGMAFDQNNRVGSIDGLVNVIQKESKLTGDLAHDISTAPDLVTVDSYRLIVESDQYKHLKPIYEERRNQIVDEETKALLRASDAHCASLSHRKLKKQK